MGLSAQVRRVYRSEHHNRFLSAEHITHTSSLNDNIGDYDCLIRISTQNQFDSISVAISHALSAGFNSILVSFEKGTYYFHTNHISFRNLYYPKSSIHFRGNGSTIVSSGHHYFKGESFSNASFSPSSVFLNSNLNDYYPWSEIHQLDSPIEIVDRDKKECRLHYLEDGLLMNSDLTNAYLQLTEWYMLGTYQITRVEDGYIYFFASDLDLGMKPYGGYNVNYDYSVSDKYPRFRICDFSYIPDCFMHSAIGYMATNEFYCCDSSTFLDFYGCDFLRIKIEGFSFVGNRQGAPFMNLYGARTTSGLFIQDCVFSAMKSTVINLWCTSNSIVINNTFRDCYHNVLFSYYNVHNTIIMDNYFEKVGKGNESTFAIRCQSDDYYIARNKLVNFGLGGIAIGKSFSSKEKAGGGIVEDNILVFTSDYFPKAKLNSLIDGGAIYLWTKNEDAIIRYNRIHNYTGPGANRGIYCDDGAYGFFVYGNVITNVDNSNLIDSRKVNLNGLPSNTNNVVMYNILGGKYKFVGSDTTEDNGCIKGENIVLYKEKEIPNYDIVIDNIESAEEDVFLPYRNNEDLSISVPRRTNRELSKLSFYNKIKKYIDIL
jgi:hypothetical protein